MAFEYTQENQLKDMLKDVKKLKKSLKNSRDRNSLTSIQNEIESIQHNMRPSDNRSMFRAIQIGRLSLRINEHITKLPEQLHVASQKTRDNITPQEIEKNQNQLLSNLTVLHEKINNQIKKIPRNPYTNLGEYDDNPIPTWWSNHQDLLGECVAIINKAEKKFPDIDTRAVRGSLDQHCKRMNDLIDSNKYNFDAMQTNDPLFREGIQNRMKEGLAVLNDVQLIVQQYKAPELSKGKYINKITKDSTNDEIFNIIHKHRLADNSRGDKQFMNAALAKLDQIERPFVDVISNLSSENISKFLQSDTMMRKLPPQDLMRIMASNPENFHQVILKGKLPDYALKIANQYQPIISFEIKINADVQHYSQLKEQYPESSVISDAYKKVAAVQKDLSENSSKVVSNLLAHPESIERATKGMDAIRNSVDAEVIKLSAKNDRNLRA